MEAERGIELIVDGVARRLVSEDISLLEALRDRLGLRSVKDGCSPQGQCGCCTVLVDGQPRVACVTPLRRVAGRPITTAAALPDADRWAEAFLGFGASQCGFCTPGIIVRLAGAVAKRGTLDAGAAREALKAHLCRCTGWQTITEAACAFPGTLPPPRSAAGGEPTGVRDLALAARRATLEGRSPQVVNASVSLGEGGFADDRAPAGALVAVPAPSGAGFVVAESLAEARRQAAKVQGRRNPLPPQPPLDLPSGEWAAVLRTSWVEPAYLETDAAWCLPGQEPVWSAANGGAFGPKIGPAAGGAARALADQHGRAVRVVFSREDVVRRAPKRPPVAGGVGADGVGRIRVARTAGIGDAIGRVAPGLTVDQVDLDGPPTSAERRAAGWAEAYCLLLAAGVLAPGAEAVGPEGGRATATVDEAGIAVTVRAGEVLDAVVLRSYCIGAAHMAYSWVRSEGLAVGLDGSVHDLTIRSFGVLRAVDTPTILITIEPSDDPPVNGSDAVFAAVAAATWRWRGFPPDWPTG